MELCYLTFFFVPEVPEEVLLFISVNLATFLLLAWLAWRIRDSKSYVENRRGLVVLIVGLWGSLPVDARPTSGRGVG